MPVDVLIVEEDPALRTTLVAALTRAGHAPVTAPSFRDGIGALTTTTPALLICSVRLGPFNGLHLLVRARAERPGLPAILLGPPSEVVAREARALGATRYLTQPIDLDALAAAVAELRAPSGSAGSGIGMGDLPVLLER